MKKSKAIKTLSCILVCALLLCGLGGCESWDNFYRAFIHKEEPAQSVIRIAVFEPLTGSEVGEASDEIDGIELAHSIFQTVLESQVELVYFDNRSDTDAAKLAAAEIVKQEDIAIVLGSCGNMLTIAGGDVFSEAGLPAIAISCSNPLITNTLPYYVRSAVVDSFRATAAAEFAAKELKSTTAAVLFDSSDDFSRARAQAFADHYEDAAGIGNLPITAVSAETDFNALFEELETAGTDTIYLQADAELARGIITTARDLGFEFRWIGPADWSGLGLEDVYYTAAYDPEAEITPMSKVFLEAYQKKFGRNKTPSLNTALGFDAYLLALAAIREADGIEDREAVTKALKSVSGLSGATGLISMTENGDPVKSILIAHTTADGHEYVYTAFSGETQTEDAPSDDTQKAGN